MYKLCVALVAVLAVAAAKPSLGYPYSAYSAPAYGVAPLAAAFTYPGQSVYSPSAYSVANAYNAAPVASYPAPVAAYSAAPVAAYTAPVQAYSAYSAYPAYSGYYGYSAPLTYGSNYGELPLWKKK